MTRISLSLIASFIGFIFIFFNVQIVFASNIVINEILPNPSSGNDWVEIYNPTSNSINLSNYIVKDSTSSLKTLSQTISGNGFLVVEVGKRLDKSGDNIYLLDNSGLELDKYVYTSDPGKDISFGRFPDGETWHTLSTPSKSLTNNSSPLASPISTPQPNSSPTQTLEFSISNIPSDIDSNQEFSVGVILKIASPPNSNFYLKGAFKQKDSSNYFGLTKVNNNWIKNNSPANSQYKIETDSTGYWEGIFSVKADPEDSGFKGEGNYIFKVARYNFEGDDLIWSNELSININHQDTPTPEKTSTPQSLGLKTLIPKTVNIPSEVSLDDEEKNHTSIPLLRESSIAGIASMPAQTNTNNTKTESVQKLNYYFLTGVLMLILSIMMVVFKLIKEGKLKKFYAKSIS